MTVMNPPAIVPNSGRPPEDDLDGLLRSYFRAEMPDPWPSFEAPAPRNGVLPLRRPVAPKRFALWHSRLALAASILLLIAAAFFVFSGSTNVVEKTTTGISGPTTADRPKVPEIPVGPEGAGSFHEELQLDGSR